MTYDHSDIVAVTASENLAVQCGAPPRQVILVLHQPLIDADDTPEALEKRRSGCLTTGPLGKCFEGELAAVGVGSGAEMVALPITVASTASVIVDRNGATRRATRCWM